METPSIYFRLGNFDIPTIGGQEQPLNNVYLLGIQGVNYAFFPYWANNSNIYAVYRERTYTLAAGSVTNRGVINLFGYTVVTVIGSEIPTVFIQTESTSLDFIHASRSNREDVHFLFVAADGSLEHFGGGDMNGRGNTTWNMPKRPYNFRLESGVSEPLFGMRPGRHWTLLANYIDNTAIRNRLALDLAKEIGISHTSHSLPVDLFINNKFVGLYDLVERRSINHAINVSDLEARTRAVNDRGLSNFEHLGVHRQGANGITANSIKYFDIPYNPEDITGGFVLEVELPNRYMSDPSGFVTSRYTIINLNAPEIASYEQVRFISNFFQGFEDAIHSENGYNDRGNHFSHYIDVHSFALFYLLHEFLMDVDTAQTSFFMYKEAISYGGSGRLYAGPAWDFDRTLGLAAGFHDIDLRTPNVFWANQGLNRHRRVEYPHMFTQLWEHEYFVDIVLELWNSDFAPLIRVLIGHEVSSNTIYLNSIEYYMAAVESSLYMDRIMHHGGQRAQVNNMLHFARARYAFLQYHWNED